MMPARPAPAFRRSCLALCLGLLAVSALPALAQNSALVRPKPRPAALAAQASGDSPYGAYLAARNASAASDFIAAIPLYARALALDPGNPTLLEGATTAHLVTGDIAGAAKTGEALLATGSTSQSATLAVLASDIVSGDYAKLPRDLSGGRSIGPMGDALVGAWSKLGQGNMTDALADFDTLAARPGLKGFALFHEALAMALSGDFEGADKILAGPDLGRIGLTRRAVAAHAEVLAQLDQREKALSTLDLGFPPGSDAAMDALRTRLKSGAPVPFDIVTSPRDGLVEALYDTATSLVGQADDTFVLMFARTAAALRPDHVEAVILSAQLLQRLDQPDLAARTYALIPATSPAYVDAEIGRADAMQSAGRTDAAIKLLSNLATAHPDSGNLQRALAEMLRHLGRYAQAIPHYDAAIRLAGTPQPGDWPLFYARAIALSELNRWPEAEADFKQALKLNPNQPQVLNYLGYSYVDRGENLDEALNMIKKAVVLAPDQGYIVDSLAWALYRLGRAKEALVPMEHASQLMPVDPVVTDHLGDVYWAVGRKMEARFQWQRALSFHPSPEAAARIRLKLKIGLDAVLQQEKAAKQKGEAAAPGPDTAAPASPDPGAPASNGG